MSLSPHQLSEKVLETIKDYDHPESQSALLETLHFKGNSRALNKALFPKAMDPKDRGIAENWQQWRELRGSVGRENEAFFTSVWNLLHQCNGLMIGDKLNSKRRLDSETILAQMTVGEQSFKLHVNHLLNKIQAPVHRQLTVEVLTAIASIFHDNASLRINDTLSTDTIIEQAVRIYWLKSHPASKDKYERDQALAWQIFYHLPPHRAANCFFDALIHLLDYKQTPQKMETEYDVSE